MATAFDPKATYDRARHALLASNWWAAAIRGVVAILIGAIAIFAPAVTLIALVMIFAAYSFVDGVFAIVLAIRGARAHERWGWLAVNGIISIAAAIAAIFFPAITILVFTLLFGAWAIVSGIATIVAALRLANSHGRWWLIAGGLIAELFGLWILLDPPLGMIALSFLIGFQALLAGFTLLALAYQLRLRSVDTAPDEGTVGDTGGETVPPSPTATPEAPHG
jgi:uncharacterized membrane protein HdeD (DUF308 family)